VKTCVELPRGRLGIENLHVRDFAKLSNERFGVIRNAAFRRRHGRKQRETKTAQRTSSRENFPIARGTRTESGVRAASRSKYTSNVMSDAGPRMWQTTLSVTTGLLATVMVAAPAYSKLPL